MKRVIPLLLCTFIPFHTIEADEKPVVVKLIDVHHQPIANYTFATDDPKETYHTLDDGLFILPDPTIQSIVVNDEHVELVPGEVNEIIINPSADEKADDDKSTPSSDKHDVDEAIATEQQKNAIETDSNIEQINEQNLSNKEDEVLLDDGQQESKQQNHAITLHIVDETFTTVEPATFQLMQDNQVVAEQQSDTDGTIHFEQLNDGDYQVVHEGEELEIKADEEKYFIVTDNDRQPIVSRHLAKETKSVPKKAPEHKLDEDKKTVSTKREIGGFVNGDNKQQTTERKTTRQTVKVENKEKPIRQSIKKQLPIEKPEVHPGDEDTVPGESPISTFKRTNPVSSSSLNTNSNSNAADDLPETGEQSRLPFNSGLLLLMTGSVLIYISRKNKLPTH